jgi:hypothetical protein
MPKDVETGETGESEVSAPKNVLSKLTSEKIELHPAFFVSYYLFEG